MYLNQIRKIKLEPVWTTLTISDPLRNEIKHSTELNLLVPSVEREKFLGISAESSNSFESNEPDRDLKLIENFNPGEFDEPKNGEWNFLPTPRPIEKVRATSQIPNGHQQLSLTTARNIAKDSIK